MKNPAALLSLVALTAACVDAAYAQPRTATPAPAVTPAPARSQQFVVNRGQGDWRATCVASRGCEAPRAVPHCGRMLVAPMSFAQVIDQRFRLDGQTVNVSGRLSAGGGCTEMACPDGVCCNHCRGDIALTGTASSSLRRLSLGVGEDAAFSCRGDDSGMCCGTAVPTGNVVVSGVLRPIAGSGGAWRIESPTLCTTE